jgi:hypothetical protein
MINMRPLAFKIKGDFGTVYITEGGIKDVAPEGVLYVANIHPDDDIIDRDSFKYDIILKHLYDILDHRYRSDGDINNIDIDVKYRNYSDIYYINIKMYHGDIEIVNSLGHKALLKEVYTKTIIKADERGMRFAGLDILRTCINTVEAEKRFYHSHSPGVSVSRPFWCSMCLGDSELYRHFFRRKRKNTDMSLYSVYLDAYLAWESKEGGPYTTIENVYNCPIDDSSVNISIDDVNVDNLIYKHADVFQVVDYNGKLTVSSDFMNHIEIEGVRKTNSYGNFFDFDILKTTTSHTGGNDVEFSSATFRGVPLRMAIEDIDKEELMPYIHTMYNRAPKNLMDTIKNRVSSIINLNYEKSNSEEVRNA